MNQEITERKISLYRKLNERDETYKERDFENYTELFSKEKLGQFEETLKEYEDKKFGDLLNPEEEFYKFYSPNYLNSKLVESTEKGYKLHFEFTDSLFYELLNYYKDDIESFLEILTQRFPILYIQSTKTYQIPFSEYQKFFSDLQNDQIKNAIRFLVRTVTNTIITDNDLFSTTIDIDLIKRYLDNLKKYK